MYTTVNFRGFLQYAGDFNILAKVPCAVPMLLPNHTIPDIANHFAIKRADICCTSISDTK